MYRYGPRTLSFSTNGQTGDPPTLMQLAGLLFISLTEYVRAVVRTLGGEEDERNLLFVLENFPSHGACVFDNRTCCPGLTDFRWSL